MIRAARIKGLPARILRFAGTGDDETDEIATEFCDLPPQAGTDWLRSVMEEHAGQWDLFRADCVQADSRVARQCQRLGGWRSLAGYDYRVALKGDFDDWLASLGASTRQRFRRTLRQAAAAGMEMRWVAPDGLAAALETLASLHQARWQAKGYPGVFASARFRGFHRDLLAQAGGQARIALCYLQQRPVAAWYGFDAAGHRYFYQSGVDTDEQGLSVGIAMHLLLIQDAFQCGADFYDFMKGPEHSYKRQFCPEPAPLYHYLVPARTVRGRLFAMGLARSGWQHCGSGEG